MALACGCGAFIGAATGRSLHLLLVRESPLMGWRVFRTGFDKTVAAPAAWRGAPGARSNLPPWKGGGREGG